MDLSCQALFLDLSGVLYEGREPVEGAADVVDAAREQGLTLRFVTNTATRSRDEIFDQLAGMGVRMEPDELFTAPVAARRFIEEKGWTPYCLVHEAIRSEFEDLAGDAPDCVILGDARDDLSYANLNRAFRFCHDGAPLVGIGMNRYFKGREGLCLDAGPFIRAVAWAADTEPIVMGKPSQAFFDQVVASTGFSADECLMVGDDVAGDVVGAVDAGLRGILVKTGKFRVADEQQLPAGADVIDSVADLLGAKA